MTMKLYVGNLSYQVTESELVDLFTTFGTVESVKIITDRNTGGSKGFGFVEMANKDEAQTAIEQLNGKAFNERTLTVNEARPQTKERNSGGGGRKPGRGNR